ncbi:hypothetical protein BCV69DRAFT_285659 [Microstroma glucosiphilum]|uniref:CRAL-TRIO domain-containing protein n=1 Tax=Pseudomicrostroma glucosiphilum TaxID=1684307 RepID=A0A316TZU6_9BASI|nr:hypothetical protein BCV69DRAFT_285659 [Pseudomicrostroma glucosiphilum]PWN17773.1 hypothetical protein BCV69DRAFT_285659 [Pseudomicrostroma glucosiphilum]
MPGLLSSSSSSSAAASSSSAVFQKHKDLHAQYDAHLQDLRSLQQQALDELPDELTEEFESEDFDGEEVRERCVAYLNDRATIFRSLRRSGYKPPAAFSLFHSTLRWRLKTDLDSLSLDSLHPLYVSPPKKLRRPPLLWLNDRFVDTLGRPVALITLRSLERPDEGGLGDVKEYIAACLEVVRRRIAELRPEGSRSADEAQPSASSSSSAPPLQCSFIFDLSSSNSSNFELELLPFLLDLLKNHYPGLVSSVHVLNFGWVHSGIWALAKRLLPRKALEKVYFVNKTEIAAEGGLFEAGRLPKELGGEWDIGLEAETDDVVRRLARPHITRAGPASHVGRKRSQSIRSEGGGGSAPVSPSREEPPHSYSHSSRQTRGLSRSGSFDSIAEHYFSAAATPRGGQSRAITPGASGRATPLEDKSSELHPLSNSTGSGARGGWVGGGWGSGGLKMTADAANKLRRLQMTRGGSAPDTNHARRADRNPAATTEATPGSPTNLKRSRSLRDFRLWEEGEYDTAGQGGGAGESFIYSPDVDDTGTEVEEVDSDASGKAGETSTAASTSRGKTGKSGADAGASTAGRGFFERWRGRGQSEEEKKAGGNATTAQHGVSASSSAPLDPHDPPRFLSRRTRKFNRVPGTVSPYNSANPFWGYPAYLVPSESGVEGLSFNPSQQARHCLTTRNGQQYNAEEDEADDDDEGSRTPTAAGAAHQLRRPLHHRTSSYAISGLPVRERQMAVRRRWRDLVRTLVYLFALRLLSLNRHLKGKVARSIQGVWSVVSHPLGGVSRGRGGAGQGEGEDEGEEVEWRRRTERYRKLRAAGSSNRSGGAAGGGRKRPTSSSRSRSFGLGMGMGGGSTPSSLTLSLRKREMAWMVLVFALTAVIATKRGGAGEADRRRRRIAAAGGA